MKRTVAYKTSTPLGQSRPSAGEKLKQFAAAVAGWFVPSNAPREMLAVDPREIEELERHIRKMSEHRRFSSFPC
jgi:hypothetical protein